MRLIRLFVAVTLFIALQGTAPIAISASSCQFVLGFAALDGMIPSFMGNCLDNEHFNTTNGDSLQDTSGVNGAVGLLVWRKADNWTAYTDGYRACSETSAGRSTVSTRPVWVRRSPRRPSGAG